MLRGMIRHVSTGWNKADQFCLGILPSSQIKKDFGSNGAMFVLSTSLIHKEQSRLEIQVSQRRLQTSFFQVFGFYSYQAIKCNLEE